MITFHSKYRRVNKSDFLKKFKGTLLRVSSVCAGILGYYTKGNG